MTDSIAAWHAEHQCFAGLLYFMDGQLAACSAGREPDYALMLDIVRYLHEFADPFHHAREDTAFERLIKHAPGLRPQVNQLLKQHRVLAADGAILLRLLDNAVRYRLINFPEVERVVATYLLYYHRHIVEEERNVLPQAARLLTPRDWVAVSFAAEASQKTVLARVEYRTVRDRMFARGIPLAAAA